MVKPVEPMYEDGVYLHIQKDFLKKEEIDAITEAIMDRVQVRKWIEEAQWRQGEKEDQAGDARNHGSGWPRR